MKLNTAGEAIVTVTVPLLPATVHVEPSDDVNRPSTGWQTHTLPAKSTIAALRCADWLGISPLAPWHYLTYHKPFYFDVSKLVALGWKPRYSNDEMFRESYDWFCQNYNRLAAEKAGSPHRRPVREGLLWFMKKFL